MIWRPQMRINKCRGYKSPVTMEWWLREDDQYLVFGMTTVDTPITIPHPQDDCKVVTILPQVVKPNMQVATPMIPNTENTLRNISEHHSKTIGNITVGGSNHRPHNRDSGCKSTEVRKSEEMVFQTFALIRKSEQMVYKTYSTVWCWEKWLTTGTHFPKQKRWYCKAMNITWYRKRVSQTIALAWCWKGGFIKRIVFAVCQKSDGLPCAQTCP